MMENSFLGSNNNNNNEVAFQKSFFFQIFFSLSNSNENFSQSPIQLEKEKTFSAFVAASECLEPELLIWNYL